ncbi:MAG: ADP-ribosylglycohydrolase family protein [Chloroflexi bacterium]|nr:ADP-ribosylglycohydrolase family protein [Chloroflexota bacterium]
MLLELAVGDAYGAGFEYARDNITQFNDLSRYVKHPTHHILPSCYTDDTQMSLAIAEVIISGVEWTPLNLANQFVAAFKRDPHEGYAGSFHEFLQQVQDGVEFLAKIVPNSDKSGAAMRAIPIGIFSTIEEVVEQCTVQAAITHNTPDGIRAAVTAALMSHYFIYHLGPKVELGKFLDQHVPGSHLWSKPYVGKVKSKGWMSVQAAVTAVMRNNSMCDLLKDCIAFTGDVDTVATIALGAACNCQEITQDLPVHLIDTLENGPYGKEYIMSLDAKLAKLYPQ